MHVWLSSFAGMPKSFVMQPMMVFVARYVITDQSDCSIGVQYIESYSTFLHLYKFYTKLPKAVFLFPNRNGISKVQQMKTNQILDTYSCNMRLYIALLCIQYPILVMPWCACAQRHTVVCLCVCLCITAITAQRLKCKCK